jgi:hypothetical protein
MKYLYIIMACVTILCGFLAYREIVALITIPFN